MDYQIDYLGLCKNPKFVRTYISGIGVTQEDAIENVRLASEMMAVSDNAKIYVRVDERGNHKATLGVMTALERLAMMSCIICGAEKEMDEKTAQGILDHRFRIREKVRENLNLPEDAVITDFYTF